MSTTNPDGGASIPADSPAEVPADNRDPGTEVPMPDGDTAPTPDTISPTPAPTEVPQTGGSFTGGGPDQGEIDADTIQNGGLGRVMTSDSASPTSSTEEALKRATSTR